MANKGRVFSKESKDKIRKAKQNTTLSQETIKKMSEAKKGKPWSEKRRAAYLKRHTMNKLVKTVKKTDLYREFLRSLDGVL